jgi:iron complex outermembrane receptor protein
VKVRAHRGALAARAALALLWPTCVFAQQPAEIEVRGTAIAAPPRAPNVAGSVISRDRLQAPGAQSADVLRTQPGVEINETGGLGSSATASVRGATAAQTPIYLAGVRLNDDVGGAAELGSVPLWFLSRIEIYRSHAPLAGDQLGLGGAIFFEPRRPRGNEAAAGGLVGSFGARAAWAVAGVGAERGSTLVGVRIDRADNDYRYLNDNGTRFDPSQQHESVLRNADVGQLDFWALSSTSLGKTGRADLVLNVTEREQGVPGIALFPTFEARQRTSRRLAAVRAHARCGSRCEVAATSAVLLTQTRYTDPLGEIGLGAAGLELSSARTEDSLTARLGLTRSISLSPALRVALERLDITGAGRPSTHARRAFARAALQGELAASERWTIYGLAAAECHGTSRDGDLPWVAPGDADPLAGNGTCGTLEASGRVGATFGTTPLTWLATLGRYSRVPTLAELYGTSGVVRGNTALLPERGVSLELGMRSNHGLVESLGGLSFDVFGFARQSERLIYYRRSAVGYVRPYNTDSARVLGLEALLSYSPIELLRCELSATLMDPRDTSPGRLVNDILPHRARVVLAPRVELRSRRRAGSFNAAKLAASYFYESRRFADQAGLVVIEPQGSLSAEAELVVLDEHLSVRARVANILDQRRFDLIGYPLPGQAAYLSTEIRL